MAIDREGHISLGSDVGDVLDAIGGVRTLGPYAVNYNDAGIDGDGFTLVEAAAGTVLLDAWCEVLTPWDQGSAKLKVLVASNADLTDWNVVFAWSVDFVAYASHGVVSMQEPDLATSSGRGAVFGSAGLIRAQGTTAGVTAGQANIYLLTCTP